MKLGLIGGIVGGIVAVIAPIVIYYMVTYNSLVRLDENCNTQLSEIDNMLKRRADLLPNLAETVKGYAKHEKEVFTAIAEARSKIGGAKSVKEKSIAAGMMESALSRLLVVVERYPDLKANQNFLRLQDELSGTENRIAVARTRYNQAVKDYNSKVRGFLSGWVASRMGLERRDFFEIENPADKEVPKLNMTAE